MKWYLDQFNTIRFGATIVTLVSIAILTCASLLWFQETVVQVRQTQFVIKQFETLLSQLKDAETGQRGYLLTGEANYLRPYQAALPSISQELQTLTQLLADSADQQARMTKLRVLITAKLAELQETIELRQQDYPAALQIVKQGEGAQLMEDIKTVTEAMKNDEEQRLQQRTRTEKLKSHLAIGLTTGGTGFSILLISGIVLQLNRERQSLQQSRDELRRSEQRYRSLVTATTQVVWVTDANGSTFDITPSWLTLTGQTKQETEGWGWLNAVHPDDQPYVRQEWETALAQNQLYEVEYRLRRMDGSYRNFLVRGVPVFDPQGTVQEWVGACTDITERRQAEQVLKQAHDQLEQRVEQRTRELTEANKTLQLEIAERLRAESKLAQVAITLKRSNQELEQFAYVASHDLQEPLRTVANYTQLLAQRYQGQIDEKADKYINYVVDGAKRMQQLINDLLTYSRIGRQHLALQQTDCNQILNEILHNLQFAIAENQAIVTAEPLPTLTADPAKLAQLLQNLISNAIKYRSEQPPKIHIDVARLEREWLFSVQDNGIGIDPQYADRIFIIFQRLHTRRIYSGTGIGLTICKKIVELHGGRIWVDSEINAGATFYFTIPDFSKD